MFFIFFSVIWQRLILCYIRANTYVHIFVYGFLLEKFQIYCSLPYRSFKLPFIKWNRVQEYKNSLIIYLNVKLKVSLVHLLGNHTFYDVYRHKLETIICWAKNVVSFTLLNFQIQKSARILPVGICE